MSIIESSIRKILQGYQQLHEDERNKTRMSYSQYDSAIPRACSLVFEQEIILRRAVQFYISRLPVLQQDASEEEIVATILKGMFPKFSNPSLPSWANTAVPDTGSVHLYWICFVRDIVKSVQDSDAVAGEVDSDRIGRISVKVQAEILFRLIAFVDVVSQDRVPMNGTLCSHSQRARSLIISALTQVLSTLKVGDELYGEGLLKGTSHRELIETNPWDVLPDLVYQRDVPGDVDFDDAALESILNDVEADEEEVEQYRVNVYELTEDENEGEGVSTTINQEETEGEPGNFSTSPSDEVSSAVNQAKADPPTPRPAVEATVGKDAGSTTARESGLQRLLERLDPTNMGDKTIKVGDHIFWQPSLPPTGPRPASRISKVQEVTIDSVMFHPAKDGEPSSWLVPYNDEPIYNYGSNPPPLEVARQSLNLGSISLCDIDKFDKQLGRQETESKALLIPKPIERTRVILASLQSDLDAFDFGSTATGTPPSPEERTVPAASAAETGTPPAQKKRTVPESTGTETGTYQPPKKKKGGYMAISESALQLPQIQTPLKSRVLHVLQPTYDPKNVPKVDYCPMASALIIQDGTNMKVMCMCGKPLRKKGPQDRTEFYYRDMERGGSSKIVTVQENCKQHGHPNVSVAALIQRHQAIMSRARMQPAYIPYLLSDLCLLLLAREYFSNKNAKEQKMSIDEKQAEMDKLCETRVAGWLANLDDLTLQEKRENVKTRIKDYITERIELTRTKREKLYSFLKTHKLLTEHASQWNSDQNMRAVETLLKEHANNFARGLSTQAWNVIELSKASLKDVWVAIQMVFSNLYWQSIVYAPEYDLYQYHFFRDQLDSTPSRSPRRRLPTTSTKNWPKYTEAFATPRGMRYSEEAQVPEAPEEYLLDI